MDKQTSNLDSVYKYRITEVAGSNPTGVTLSARCTSGKTYTLFVSIALPAPFLPMRKVVVRLHRKAHKLFWQIVRAAQAFLDGFKLLFAPSPLLLPATIGAVDAPRSDSEKLLTAAANIPVKAEQAKVAAYDWKARKAQSDAIPEKRFNSRWDKAAANPGTMSLNPRRKSGLA